MRIITVANQKGGCGKTTTVINLAASLAHFGKKVLIIDMDPQGHVGIGLGILRADQINQTIYDVLCDTSNEQRIDSIIINCRENVDLAPSNISLSALEQKMAGADKREELLIKAIFTVYEDYDYILIDTPPNVGLLTFNALRACREVIIPIDSSYFGLHGLGKLLQTVLLLNERLNHTIRIKALSTLVDKRTKVSMDVLQEIRNTFNKNTFQTEINLNVKLKEAVGLGLPVLEYDPNCNGTQDYLNLAEEIISEEKSIEIQTIMKTLQELNDKALEGQLFSPRFVDGGVVFTLKNNEVKSIKIAGDFNNWSPSEHDVFIRDEKGVWSKNLNLNPGLYQYKLIIDGRWVPDPNNPIRVQSPMGGSNSVLFVK